MARAEDKRPPLLNAQWNRLTPPQATSELKTADTPKNSSWRTEQSETVRPGLHTEHHAGHEQRIVPITPNLAELIQDRFDECQDGEERLVTIRVVIGV